MRVAVDSTILLDILLDDPTFGDRSTELLTIYLHKGSVIISPIAFVECGAAFANPAEFETVAREMGLQYKAFTPDTCSAAAASWSRYRKRGGPRRRILPDFLIGAHAQILAEALLTRDRGFYRDYFDGLEVLAP